MSTFFDHLFTVFPLLIRGAGFTLSVTVIAVAFGILLGLFAALGKLYGNRLIRGLCNIYIEAFRGTPLYVQIFLFHFGVASVIGAALDTRFHFSIMTTAIVVCSLNSGAYVAEIFRAGIQGVDKGQMEAARSLGMNHSQAMRQVILPQAFKAVIPPLGNEFVMLLKDTSLLSAIGANEIMKAGQVYNSTQFAPFPAFFGVALVYFALTFTFTRIINWYEKKLETDGVQTVDPQAVPAE